MTEAMSGLIQMTAHTRVTARAQMMITSGCILAAVCVLLALGAALSKRQDNKPRYVALFLFFALASAAMAVSGAQLPRQKVLYCCASGPVSLEAVATVYDIVGVDGKMLTLAERQGG